MYCVKCGTQIPDDSHFCVQCGHCYLTETPEAAANTAEEEKARKLGLISMILGIASVATQFIQTGDSLSLPAAIAALVLAYISKGRSGKGKTHPYAKTGLICGYVGIGVNVLSTIFAVVVLVLYFFFMLMVGSDGGQMYDYI